MTDIRLRTCERRDLGRILAIEVASFNDPYNRLDFEWCLQRSRDGFIVAYDDDDDAVVGYVVTLREGDEGRIVSMAVAPAMRRRGIGTLLLKKAVDALAGRVVRVHLEVRPTNVAARALYRKLSFVETGEIKRHYYADGEDAVVMVREL